MPEVYEFGDYKLEVAERRLSQGARVLSLAPKEHDVLVALLRHAGSLVTKRELLDLVWPESHVEEGIVAVHVSALRRALGESRRLIETVARFGYRFTGDVRRIAETAGPFSIAVLPAHLFSAGPLALPGGFAGLALADALIDRLGRFTEIIVRPTRAIREYAGSHENPAAIGQALRVDAVLEVQFVAAADGLTLSAQLVRSRNGARLWSAKFDAPAGDPAAAVDSIAESVAAHLALDSPRRARAGVPTCSGVYELCGRGRSLLLSGSMFDVPKAAEAFRAAADLYPGYAPAHAGLALACCAQAAFRVAPSAEAYHSARSAALRALAVEDSSADAQAALGAVLFFGEWNWAAAEKSLKRALELNPNHSEAYQLYGQLLEALGRLSEGLQMKLKALERDPLSPFVHLQLSLSYWHQRRYDDAIHWANRALELDPKHRHAREHLAGAYWKKGDAAGHFAESLKHAELHGVPQEALRNLREIFEHEGRVGLLKLTLHRAERQPEAFPAMQLALFCGELGDLDAAFGHLDRAIESRDPALVHLAVAPQWDALRQDDRFAQRVSRMGLTPRQ